MAMQEQTTQVLQLYTAYFNRVADSAGVDYWLNEMTNNGWSVNEVAVTFSQQVEYTNLYAGLSYAQIVAQVYTNVLNRTADVAGAAYWESELSNGTIGVSQLVQAVINAAIEKDQNGDFKNFNDATLFNNKIEVSEFAYIVGSNETHLSLADITTQSSTVTDAKSQINPEPNDEKSMATPITLDDAMAGIDGSVNITDITDDVDWYKITLDQAGTYTVYMETLAGTTSSNSEETYLVVTDSYGTNLLTLWHNTSLNSSGDWLRDTFEVNTAGDYYINVQRDLDYDAVYEFSVQPSIANGLVQDANNELNDEKSMATPITLDDAIAGINGSVNITDITDDVDWYKITLDQAGTYTVYMETLAGTTIATAEDAYLVVTDSYGTNLLNLWDHATLDRDGEWLRDTFEVTTAGDYYINVQREHNYDAVYEFSVQPSIANGLVQDANNELNDEKSMATPITLDDAIAGINGSVNITDITDDVDWYKITLDQAGTYTVYMETLVGTTSTVLDEAYLVVTDSYGTNLLNLWDHASLTSNGEWLRDTFVANAAGDYYINVQRYDNLDTVYNFSLEIA